MYALIVTMCTLSDKYQYSGETVPLTLVSKPTLKHWYTPSHTIVSQTYVHNLNTHYHGNLKFYISILKQVSHTFQ